MNFIRQTFWVQSFNWYLVFPKSNFLKKCHFVDQMGFKALLVQFYYSALINSIFTYRSKWSLRCQNRNIRPTFRTSGQSTYLLKGGFLKIQQTIIWPTIKYAPKIFKVLPTALSLLLGTLRDLNIKKRTLREVNQP